MAFELAPLPYARDALEPVISAKTMDFHYGKHHQTYVTNLNNLVKDTPLAGKSLEEVIKATHDDPARQGIFNNAAQVWNHDFFWKSMKKGGGGAMPGALEKKIVADFGSVDAFREAFTQAGLTQFGSGWAWLEVDNGKLKVTKTPNAHTPVAHGRQALIVCDVWEHAYYLDYQNRRGDFLKAFLDSLVNWDFAAEQLAKAA
ncbi:MAG: superoxide dismutase [Pseudomonadota bacterium]|nr:superoxide dismutase [Pseudomonadota bacterium]